MSGGFDHASLGRASDRETERLARMAWSRLAGPGDTEARNFVGTLGPVAAIAEVLKGHGASRWRDRVASLRPSLDRAALHQVGGRVLIPGDDDWPSSLKALGHQAPFCLWMLGVLDLERATARSVAITGSRAATLYGITVAGDLAAGCITRDITVVAGAAYGIDGAAHQGALAHPGRTIAVLASGTDHPYPRGHKQLLDQISLFGSVVSENPPGTVPDRERSVARNRLIAALSQATVVVEAGYRAQVLRIAAEARKLGLPVGAVPGPVTSLHSTGCHWLLREGAACITSSTDLAELLDPTE